MRLFCTKNVGISTHFGLFLSKKLLIKAGMMLNNLIIRGLLKGSVFGINAMKGFKVLNGEVMKRRL